MAFSDCRKFFYSGLFHSDSKNILRKFDSSEVQPISFVLCGDHAQRGKYCHVLSGNVVCSGGFCSVCYIFEAKEHVLTKF